MKVDEQMIPLLQQHLEYTEEEARLFLSDTVRADLAVRASELSRRFIVAEVVDTHGCGCQHHLGDRIYFNGLGQLLVEKNKKNVCIYAMSALAPTVYAANELFFARVDPNEMRLRRAGCFDVGVNCGGVGHVVFEFSMVDSV